ncbi:hypothetical protein XarjCFBP7653_14900 [Xanthomonas arboricola]|nr:hypothetical protein XarjCFBP7653_14900 [Xanthomonas arboricola]
MSFVVPIGWCSATLEDVARWAAGGTPSRANTNFFSGNIPWIKTGELGSRFIAETEEHISEEAITASSAKIFPSGSVALAMYGATIGKASILAIDAATNQACAVGIPDGVSSEFLYYFLLSQRNLFEEAGKGGAQPNISQGIVKAWPLLVPPQAEQGRIIEKLEELLCDLDAGMAELKAAQRKLVQYRQSLLKAALEGTLTADWRAARAQSGEPQETGAELLQRILTERRTRWEAKRLAKFAEQGKVPPRDWKAKYPEPAAHVGTKPSNLPNGWTWATVDQISVAQNYGSSAKTNEDGTGIPVLRMGNIQEGELDLGKLKFLPQDHGEFPELFLEDGDILFNRTNSPELVGKTAVFRSEITPCSYASYLIKVRLSNHCSPELVSAYINSVFGRHWVKTVVTQQVGQANVNGSKLAALAVPLPPTDEQVEIARILVEQKKASFRHEAMVNRSLRQSTAQRKNILKAAFTGQLVPQDPNDEPASMLLERIRAERVAADAKRKGKTARKTKERT